MSRVDRPLDNPINWSFRLGRIVGVELRVHVAFLVAFVLLVWIELPVPGEIDTRSNARMLLDAIGTFGLLAALVLIHELGHWIGLRAFGGRAERLLLWPLGAQHPQPTQKTPAAVFAAAAGGPVMNVAVCAICSGAIILWFGALGAVPWNPFHPMTPINGGLFPTLGQEWLIRTFGLSYVLLSINFLPLFPFDGGRMLHAWLWAGRGYRNGVIAVAGTGMVTALVVGLIGIFHEHGFLLILIAVFGYLTCWQMRGAAQEGYAAVGGELHAAPSSQFRVPEADLETNRKRRGFLAELRTRRQANRIEAARKADLVRQDKVDDILRKVAQKGLASLTRLERRVLADETRRRRKSAE